MKNKLFLLFFLASSASASTWVKINRSSCTLTVYNNNVIVSTYPIAVGRKYHRTPVGRFIVTEKIRNPIWYPPPKMRIEDPTLPKIMKQPNPLGPRWIGISRVRGRGVARYGMHGTTHPESIGSKASFGCIRLFNKDIVLLYNQVKIGTVIIIE